MTTPAAPDFAQFAALVAGNFGVPAGDIVPATTAADVDGWDSISHTRLIIAIEDAYAISFADEDVFDLADVGALFDRVVALCAMTNKMP